MRFVLLTFILATSGLAQRTTPVENDQVRVLSVVDKPTANKGAMHEHAMNRVMIYLDEGQPATLVSGRARCRPVRRTGDGDLGSEGQGMHQSENPGTSLVRIVEIELKGEPKSFHRTRARSR